MKKCFLVITIIVFAFSIALGQETGKKKMTMLESLMLPSWRSYRLSPDGEKIAFTKSERDPEDFSTISHIYIYDLESGTTMQLTNSEKGESGPLWLPGSRVIFTSDRGEDGSKRWVISLKGGEAIPFFDDEEAPNNGSFSKDFKKIAYTKRTERLDKEEWDKQVKKKDDGYFIEKKLTYTHLWVYDIESKKHKQITSGEFDNSGASWSPDGKWIAFSSNRTGTQMGDPGRSDNSDIWIVSSDSGSVRQLTNNRGPDRGAVWSPDGRWITYSASMIENSGASQNEIMVISFEGGAPVNLTKDLNYSASGPRWSNDGKNIYFTAAKGVSSHLYSVPYSGGELTEVFPNDEYVYGGYSMSDDGSIWLFTGSSFFTPGEVFMADIDGSNIRNIISPTNHMGEFEIADSEVITWKGADGWDIEGIITYPIGYEPGNRYPLILQVHGGPHGRYSKTFNSGSQIWATRGYIVLRGNPRGSSGRTFEFSNANANDWGGKDYIDIMNGVDHVVEMGIADPERMAIMGGSYGGFMTFWAITQTNRFIAAIGHAGISDWYSFYGQTDIPYLLQFGFGGIPYESKKTYEKWSPIEFAENVTTPLLITHGEEDNRVPIPQAEQYYRSLKKLGKTVEFIKFPREGHGIREPRHRLHLDKEQEKWMEKYLLPERWNDRLEKEALEKKKGIK